MRPSSRPLFWLLFALAWLLAAPPGAASQEPTRETQLPLDTLQSVWEVDADLRRQLGLFPEVEGFQVARLFVTQTGGYVLEISLQREGRLVRERRVLSAMALAELRDRLAVAMAERGIIQPAIREGRAGLVLGQTALALGFYGWALPAVLDIDSTRGAVATYLLTAGTGFYLPYRITRSIPVTEAHRDAVFWGGTRGILYGALLGDALTLGDDEEAEFQDDNDERVILGLGMALSVAGSVLGYQAVDAADAGRGDVALWSTIGDLSLGWGFGLSTAVGLYDGDLECHGDVCEGDDVESTTAGHLGTLAVGAGGLWFAEWMADREAYTVGDARALRSFAVLGAQAALPLAWAAFEDMGDGHRPLAATLVAGSAAGLWWGNRTLRRTSLTGGEGLLVQAGHLAGGLVATGLTFLTVDDSGGDREILYMSTSAAGSILGSLLTFAAVTDGGTAPGDAGSGDGGGLPGSAGAAGVTGPGAGPTSRRTPSVELHVNGLWAPFVLDPDRRTRVPVLTIRH